MRETQQSICEWADATFGTADYVPRIFSRVHEELTELITGLTQVKALAPVFYSPAALIEEAADATIIMCRLAKKAGLDFLGILDRVPNQTDPLPAAIHATSLLLDAMERVVTERDEIDSARTQGYLILIIMDLSNICHALGGSLAEAIDNKMTICRASEFKVDNTGHGYRVK